MTTCRCISDAPNLSYAAFTSNVELTSVMTTSLNQSEMDRMSVNILSSTASKTKSVRLALTMQMCEAARMPNEPRSFCNTWVEHLVVTLPPLAVAIDDSLMALVERGMTHLAAASPNQLQSTGLGSTAGQMSRAYPCSPAPGGSWTPSASSPMTLLEQARQAKQLNDALDSFGASRYIGDELLLLLIVVHM